MTNPPRLVVNVDTNNPTPPEEQVFSQLKIAIMLGTLRAGQNLLSIRELQKETGVGRNVIWRAYSRLAKAGLVHIEGRKRAVVNSNAWAEEASELVKTGNWLSREILERLQALKINPHSFLRLLTQRVAEFDATNDDIVLAECNALQAKRFSTEISNSWGCRVRGMEIREIQNLTPQARRQFQKILTPTYHSDQVIQLLGNSKTKVIPLRLDWNEQLMRELQSSGVGARMAFVFPEFECREYGHAFARELNYLNPSLRIDLCSWKNSKATALLVASRIYKYVLLSGLIWEDVDEETKASPIVIKRALELNKSSLEEARIRAGVIL